MAKYKATFISAGSRCESDIEVDSIGDIMATMENVEWLILTGEPTLSINLKNVESIKFEELTDETSIENS